MRNKNIILFITTSIFIFMFVCNVSAHQVHSSQRDALCSTPPDGQKTSHFDTYDELYQALTSSDSDGYGILRENLSEYGELYQKTLSAYEKGDIPVLIPYFNGEKADLRYLGEGYSIIAVFTHEQYDIPWIWYHCVTGENEVDVKFAHVSVIDGLDSAKSYRDVLSELAPTAPLPENKDDFDTMSAVYEKDILLADGTKTEALFYEYKDDERVWARFYLDGTLIAVRAKKEALTESFWSSFSVSEYGEESVVPPQTDEGTAVTGTDDGAIDNGTSPKTAVIIGTLILAAVVALVSGAYVVKRKRR